jgi:hypothetical protein
VRIPAEFEWWRGEPGGAQWLAWASDEDMIACARWLAAARS